MDKMTIAGMVVAGGLIGTFWRKIRDFFERIVRLLIIKVTVEDALQIAVQIYCFQNLKRSPFDNKTFSAFRAHIKQKGMYQTIGYEYLGKETSIMWKGWKPLVLSGSSSRSNDGDMPRTANGNSNKMSVSYIRGMWNIDTLLIESLDLYNKNNKYGTKSSRFYVRKIFGRVRETHAGKEELVERAENKELGDRRLLKWDVNDIGYVNPMKRPELELLALPQKIHGMIKEIKRWHKSKAWYLEKGIPWKRGWLLYGIPGTGKTSLVRAIAENLDLPVWIFDLGTLSNEEFDNYWTRMTSSTPMIALLEDLDATFDGRKNMSASSLMRDKLSFDCLLNCLDGVERADGVFTVITTNRIEKLDPSLGIPQNGERSTRPGRIDRVIELKVLDEECRFKLANRILCDYIEVIDSVVEEGEGDTGAQFQDRCAQIALKEYWRIEKGGQKWVNKSMKEMQKGVV